MERVTSPHRLTNGTAHQLDSRLSRRAQRSTSSVIRDLLSIVDRPGMLSLAGGLPSSELLPTERVRVATEAILSTESGRGLRALQYGPTHGMAELRESVSMRYGWSPDSLVVTTGSQQAIDLLCQSIIDEGDVVVVEAPCYLGSLQVFCSAGVRIAPIPGDSEGMNTDALEQALRDGMRPKIVSVVSEFANPTGATLSMARRHHLVNLADRYDFLVLDDNPYGELRWSGTRPDRLDSMSDRVITIGSASKILAPGLRIGWIHGPEWLLRAVVTAKQSADLHTSSLDQLIVAEILGDREFMDAHLRRVRTTYARRCEALVGALDRHLGSSFSTNRPEGGMFVWGQMVGDVDADLYLAAAIDAGVAFVPGHAFSADPRHRCAMRLCFATLSEDDLEEAARRLAVAQHRADGLFGVRTA